MRVQSRVLDAVEQDLKKALVLGDKIEHDAQNSEMEKDLEWCKEVGSNPKETMYCGKYDYLEMCVLHNYHHLNQN